MPLPLLPAATIGALCAIGASAAFTLNDVAIKSLSGDYALHQVILIRSTLALIATLAVIMPLTGGWAQIRTSRPVLHLVRGGFVVAANLSFYTALAAMPLAEATAIFFISPLILAGLSVLVLGETVGPLRWVAIGVGFVGVIIIIQPGGSAFQPVSLLPLVSAACYAATHIMTRKLGLRESAATLAFYIQLTFCIFSVTVGLALGDGWLDRGDQGAAIAFLTRAWVWPPLADWPVFLLAGLGAAVGGLLISQAYRLCEAALVGSLEYIALPMAIVWGCAIFGEWPAPAAWAGIVLILGAGLSMIWRETRRRELPTLKTP